MKESGFSFRLRGVLLRLFVVLFLVGLVRAGTVDLKTLPEAEERPVIDGVLDEEAWKHAVKMEGFRQVDPDVGMPVSEKTTAYLMADEKALYIGFRCEDRTPEAVVATVMQRDAKVGAEDYVYVLLDPYRRGRQGYYFRVNSIGGKGEGLVGNRTTRPAMAWDTIWDTMGKRFDWGWSAEFRIPFRSLTFDPDNTEWGIEFGRRIPRRKETARWAAANRSVGLFGLDETGVLAGVEGRRSGLGLQLDPYLTSRWTESDGFDVEVGLDAIYQITPSLSATLTYNTDFAETEVDERRVNLTRFPLFFPEKRNFFLEGMDLFAFGKILRSPLPFHSRTIGLSAGGEKVGIRAGGKLVGRAGPLGIGLIGVGLDGGEGLASDEVFAGRLVVDVFEESALGALFTYGDPQSDGDNWIGGLDLNLRTSQLANGASTDLDFWVQHSEDSVRGSDEAFGVQWDYPNDPLWMSMEASQVGENFEPAMGFVRRRGIREYHGLMRYDFYPEVDWIREIEVGGSGYLVTDLGNDVETEEWRWQAIEIQFPEGDEFEIEAVWEREVLAEDFEIRSGTVIPAGDYRWDRLAFEVETAGHRPVSLEVEGSVGGFYGGRRTVLSGEVEVSPSRYWQLSAGGVWNGVDLPEGEFETLVAFAGLRVTPSPQVSWNTLVQYDTVSEVVGLNSRLRWILKPGCDVYLVFNQGYLYTDGRGLDTLRTEAVTKVGWSIRF